MIDYAAARLNMVDSQLRTNKVTDEAVLDAFLAVPRERFVPPALHGAAYIDDDIPLGGHRALLAPMVLARLLQLAAIGPGDAVLEIGCANGYCAAILSRLARSVVAIDSNPALVGQARMRLRELGIGNVTVVETEMNAGYEERSPYAVIVIAGAVSDLPETIASQLADGGRLVTVVEGEDGVGQAMLMTRVAGVLSRRPHFDAAAPPLPGFQAQPSFVF
jgi:protein-L-isoaspartate(D-aspartate) O-methyltransferase